MHIQSIKVTDKIGEAWHLLEMHREELATYKHLMVLKPDIENYKKLEAAGKLIGLGLYDEEKLIGYSIFILTTALHYSDLVIAQNDILFVHPDYRKSKWGLRLIRDSEQKMKRLGAHVIFWHGKEQTNFSAIMPKLGYRVQDIIFSKEL